MRALYAQRAPRVGVPDVSADRQWPMTALAPMAAAAEAGADFVIGVRSNKREVYTPYRRVISWGYERIVRALGAPGGDPGSIKLARRELLARRGRGARRVRRGRARDPRGARRGARRRGAGRVSPPRRRARRPARAAMWSCARSSTPVRVAASLALGWPRRRSCRRMSTMRRVVSRVARVWRATVAGRGCVAARRVSR